MAQYTVYQLDRGSDTETQITIARNIVINKVLNAASSASFTIYNKYNEHFAEWHAKKYSFVKIYETRDNSLQFEGIIVQVTSSNPMQIECKS